MSWENVYAFYKKNKSKSVKSQMKFQFSSWCQMSLDSFLKLFLSIILFKLSIKPHKVTKILFILQENNVV